MKIPFSPPDITDAEINAVAEALRSGWITTGPRTKEFERKVAAYCHTTHAVCLNSATAALELSLRILGIGEGDEVITSAYTYTASASVVEHIGAKIVLVDTLPDSYEMDYDQLEKAITDKTKAIIPVDIGGVLCDYDRIYDIVEKKRELFKPNYDKQGCWITFVDRSRLTEEGKYINPIMEALGRVAVVSDSAHGFGAKRHGRISGEIADITTFSFHAVKNLTTGEGGAAAWKEFEGVDSETIYKIFQLLSLHGQSKDALAKNQLGAWEYDIVGPWYKCNMTDIMAAIGLAQFDRYLDILNRRKELIDRYDSAIDDINEEIKKGKAISGRLKRVDHIKHYGDDYSSSGHLYLIRLIGEDRSFANRFITAMAEKEVATNVHYKPLPMHTAYKAMGFDIKDYPNAFHQFENEVTLPLHTCLTDEMQEYVISCMREILLNND